MALARGLRGQDFETDEISETGSLLANAADAAAETETVVRPVVLGGSGPVIVLALRPSVMQP